MGNYRAALNKKMFEKGLRGTVMRLITPPYNSSVVRSLGETADIIGMARLYSAASVYILPSHLTSLASHYHP